MTIITVDEARAYAHDNESTDAEMTEYIALAEKYMENAIGTFNPEDFRARHLAKLLVCEFDNNRTTSAKDANSRSRLVESIILQLKISASVSNLDTEATEATENA